MIVMNKTTKFKELLHSDQLEFLMEAHNGLSAKIVEEIGFKGIWASGLSISAALGVRDNNEASWTQVLDVVEFMSDATNIPILLDGDTGYGNFNNMRRLVHKLEQRGVAGVCIEDKLFPKTNSFIKGEHQPLADMDEFCGKIRAGKDAQTDSDFCIIARLEGFIAGWGLDEVLERAHAYCEAGADGLLVHSKKATPDQILAFAEQWDRPCPLVIVPTMYYSTPTEVFERAGISVVIWANHNVRSVITAVRETSARIYRERSVGAVEDRIATVKDVFRLQNADELAQAEERYLPKRAESTRAIVLAASQGRELGSLTSARPKAMVDIGGTPLLHRLVGQFRQAHIKDVVVVRGYGKDEVHAPDVQFVDSDDFEGAGELVSLAQTLPHLDGEVVISFGDILFRKYILNNLLAEDHDIVVVVDAAWRDRNGTDRYHDFVQTSRPYSLEYDETPVLLARMDPSMPHDEVHGEWIGLVKASPRGSRAIADALGRLRTRADFRQLRFKDLFADLVEAGHDLHVLYITGHWLDVDNLEDLSRAQTF
jgi:phosphoenolpyruvate phosphomutase